MISSLSNIAYSWMYLYESSMKPANDSSNVTAVSLTYSTIKKQQIKQVTERASVLSLELNMCK